MNNIAAKLFKVQQEIGGIKKTADNPFFKSKYFDINALLETVKPMLTKHGLLLLQPLDTDNEGRTSVTTILVDIDSGESLESSIFLPTLNKPQDLGSAITYYRRYSIQTFLGLQAEDDDGNVASGNKTKPKATRSKPQARSSF